METLAAVVTKKSFTVTVTDQQVVDQDTVYNALTKEGYSVIVSEHKKRGRRPKAIAQ